MNKYVEAALESYEAVKTELKNFTRVNTDFELDIDDGGYPLVFTFSPSEDAAQESMFEPDENGVLGDMRVICSSAGAGVDLGLKCHQFGPRAAHQCAETRDELHRYGQKKAMREQGWSVDEFVRQFGKNYLDEDELRELEEETGAEPEQYGAFFILDAAALPY